MGFSTKTEAPATRNVPVAREQLSTNQQTVPVPWWWGRRKVALRWIAPATNQISVEAPDSTPTKK